MSAGWVAKRFWQAASVEPEGAGYGIRLDDRPLRTPAKAALIVPTRAFAQGIAGEWLAQGEVVRPDTMPLTRAANSAIDAVAPQRQAVVAMLAAYADSDLLCYRAAAPRELVARQALAWDPLLRWAADSLGVHLRTATGITHVAQPPASLARSAGLLGEADAFRLAGLHDLIAISGSLVLGLAVAGRHLAATAAWTLSRIDEDWQVEHWGADAEAEAKAALRRRDFLQAETLLHLLEDEA